MATLKNSNLWIILSLALLAFGCGDEFGEYGEYGDGESTIEAESELEILEKSARQSGGGLGGGDRGGWARSACTSKTW